MSKSSTDLSTFIEKLGSKYSKLVEYFTDVELDDLRYTTPDRAVDCVPPHLRLLTHILVSKHLRRYFDSDPYSIHTDDTSDPEDHFPVVVDGRIDFRGTVISSQYKHLKGNLIAMHDLVNVLEEHKVDFSIITELNFHECDLFDDDIAYVSALASKCVNCTLIDLSSNRLCWDFCDDFILIMLEKSSVRFVNIIDNPLVCADRRDFFQKLSKEIMNKLVCIPQEWIPANRWRAIFPMDAPFELIAETHNHFHELRKVCKK